MSGNVISFKFLGIAVPSRAVVTALCHMNMTDILEFREVKFSLR
jgi:hypothetical protein